MKKILQIVIAFICIITIANLHASAQCCQYKISMHDSYGDGWNGGQLKVYRNNILVGTYSATNFGSLDSFLVCNSDSIKLQYTAGNYENENSYQIYASNWNLIFADGNTPQTGYVDTFIGNCNIAAMPGNNPCNAITIDTLTCLWNNNTNFSGSGLVPNCASYQGKDVWYSIIVPPSGNLSLETDSGTINDTGIAAWTDSTCHNLRLLDCDDDNGNGYYSFLTLYDLTPGQKLYIQVFGYGSATGTFKICVKDLGTISLDSSELPIVIIKPQGQQIVANNKINCNMDIKYNGPNSITYINSAPNIYNGNIGIEVRGATSSGYPQKPYGIETRLASGANNNVSLLNMPAENDWVLLSNFNDRSLVRNSLACKLFGDMGNYSVRTHLCEVLVDSSYKGIYTFAEKIKQGNNRVNIAKLKSTDSTGDALTGGYILGQNYWDANNSFLSNFSPIDHPTFDVRLLYEYPKPDSILQVQKTYIAKYIDTMETALYNTNFADTSLGYRKYLDVKSFIDYFIVNELARNNDGFKKSVFFNKDKNSNGGKLKAGPVWDFDWAWKNIDNCNTTNSFNGSGWAHKVNDCPTDNYSTGWYIRLMQDTNFNNEMKCYYNYYRTTMLSTSSIFNYIDSVKNKVKNAQVRHFKKWPVLGKSGPAPEAGPSAITHAAEMDSLKIWISKRLTWLDANMPGTCNGFLLANTNIQKLAINCYPNPTNAVIHFSGFGNYQHNAQIYIYNTLGQIITTQIIPANTSIFSYNIKINGLYTYKIVSKNGVLFQGKFTVLR